MNPTANIEEQLCLLENLINYYTQQELAQQSLISSGDFDRVEKINQNWKRIRVETENHIKVDPTFVAQTAENGYSKNIRRKIFQVIDASQALGNAYQQALLQWTELHRAFGLTEDRREYKALQGYLRSIAKDSKPRVAIFDEIDKAIEDLKPLEELAADLASEHLGQQQLQQRIQQFVADLKAILDAGKGSLALETVG